MIRNIKKDDISKLLPLFKYGYNIHENKRPDKFATKSDDDFISIIDEFIKEDNMDILIIEEKGVIIGYLAYEIIDRVTKYIWIDELVISPEEQNKGHAKRLLEYLEKYAKSIGCKRIEFGCWYFNEKALNIYKHMQYQTQKIIFEKEI